MRNPFKKRKPTLVDMEYPRDDCPACGSKDFLPFVGDVADCAGCQQRLRLDGDTVVGVL